MLLTEKELRKIIRQILNEDIVGTIAKGGEEVLKSKYTDGAVVSTGEIESATALMQSITDTLAKYLDIKDVKWAEKEIEFLMRNPALKTVFDKIAPYVDKIDNLINSPLAAKVLRAGSEVIPILIAFCALPSAIGMILDNLGQVEGMLENQKKYNDGKTLSYEDLAKEFDASSMIKRLSGANGRDDIIKILAMDLINKIDANEPGKYVVQKLHEDGVIDDDFKNRVLKKRFELKKEHIDMKEIQRLAKTAEIKHKGIMLGLFCNMLKAGGVNVGPVGADDVVKLISSATGITA